MAAEALALLPQGWGGSPPWLLGSYARHRHACPLEGPPWAHLVTPREGLAFLASSDNQQGGLFAWKN